MSSVYWQILTAVQTEVESIVANCVLRKKLELLETDTLPLTIVAPGSGGEKVDLQTFSRNVCYVYPVLVSYIVASDGTVGLQQSFIDTREEIRNALYQTLLSGAATVFDTSIDPAEASKLSAYLGTNYDVTGWLVRYKSHEIRTS